MGEDLVLYFERMELMAFFSGYPLVYAIVQFVAGDFSGKRSTLRERVVWSLPVGYAITGVLFLGMVIKNLSLNNRLNQAEIIGQLSFGKIWGVLAIIFFIPVFRKKPVFSLLHSMVFFLLLLKDLVLHMTSSIGRDVIKNDMKIYTDSLLLNTITLVFAVSLYYIYIRIRRREDTIIR